MFILCMCFCAANSQQLDMAVEGGKCSVLGSIGNDQPYMFISDSSALQSLAGGIFAAESLTDRVATIADQQKSEMLSSEAAVPIFETVLNPSDLGAGDQKGLAASAAVPSVNLSVDVSDKRDNPHPLGSSQNPIRIIQHGNKYTSLQELTPEQLNQIMQVCCVVSNSVVVYQGC